MRRSRTRDGIAISLFLFLQFCCARWVLLVLLVLFGNSMSRQDERVVVEPAMQMEAELQGRVDSLSWRLEQLKEMRSKTSDELETLRLQLAGIEDNSRNLAAELKALQKVREDLFDAKLVAVTTSDEMRELEAELASARESLDEARKEEIRIRRRMQSYRTKDLREHIVVLFLSNAVWMEYFCSPKVFG